MPHSIETTYTRTPSPEVTAEWFGGPEDGAKLWMEWPDSLDAYHAMKTVAFILADKIESYNPHTHTLVPLNDGRLWVVERR